MKVCGVSIGNGSNWVADPGEERLQTFSRGLGRKTEKFPNRILIGWLVGWLVRCLCPWRVCEASPRHGNKTRGTKGADNFSVGE